MDLVLSLFPGIGMLDRAFEEEGFCVVRGPDVLWGGDVKRFHPPRGRFNGVIGGDPCQAWSQLRYMIEANGFELAEYLGPEYDRILDEAQPDWFLRENVPAAPPLEAKGFHTRDQMLCDLWVGGLTQRERRFTFGARFPHRFQIETLALHPEQGEPAVTRDLRRRPVAIGGSGKRKPNESGGKTSSLNRGSGAETLERMLELQGLPADFFRDDSPFTQAGKKSMVGNGVPIAMGRAVARAVKAALQSRERAA